jgi:hypothetical protein
MLSSLLAPILPARQVTYRISQTGRNPFYAVTFLESIDRILERFVPRLLFCFSSCCKGRIQHPPHPRLGNLQACALLVADGGLRDAAAVSISAGLC